MLNDGRDFVNNARHALGRGAVRMHPQDAQFWELFHQDLCRSCVILNRVLRELMEALNALPEVDGHPF